MKVIGYLIFAAFYYMFRLCPINNKKVFCIMTHDGSRDSSVGVIVQYLSLTSKEYHFEYIKKEQTNAVRSYGILGNFLSFFVVKPYHLATSAYVMQDNIFLPLAFIRFPKKVKVIQLWHGTGTIKKFGQSVNTGSLGRLEKKANKTITHLIVNSEYTKNLYAKAFGISLDRIYVMGLPRTDIMFDEDKKNEKLNNFFREYPDCRNKKIILYAPTFRDQEVHNPQIPLDLELIRNTLPKDIILILKLHPFVASSFAFDESKYEGSILNLSSYNDLNTLLFAADILITDYSSIIFEYSILERPMIFYAYDLEEFSDEGRGFYETYEEYVPGPIVKTSEELIQIINNDSYNLEKVRQFRENSYDYLDGQSTVRFVKKIYKM